MPFPDFPYNGQLVTERKTVERVPLKWFGFVTAAFNAAFLRVSNPAISRSALSASIAATSITAPTLAAGLYLITIYAQATTAATTSSSIAPFVTHVVSGVTVTQLAPFALTANTPTNSASWTFLVRSDALAVIKYGVTYGSVGATAMVYRLDVALAQVPT